MKSSIVWVALLGLSLPAYGDPGKVLSHTKLSSLSGGIPPLPDFSLYGVSVANIGDIDQDGIDDIAVGAYVEADGGPERGALYIHFMKADGTAKATQKISSTQGNFTAILEDGDGFGNSIAPLGDFDGDGVPDIAVGAWLDDDGGCCPGADRGSFYVLRLNPNGTVKAWNQVSSLHGGLPAILIDDSDRFGQSMCNMGDLDGDGVVDLAVGALYDGDTKVSENGGVNTGAVYIVYLTPQGTVKSLSKISNYYGGFQHTLKNQDRFGFSVANIGDLNEDGVVDLAVGAIVDQDGGQSRGAAYVLFLNANGSVKGETKLSSLEGGATSANVLAHELQNWDFLGHAVSSLGDLDGDGVIELAVTATGEDDGGGDTMFSDKGCVWIFSLNEAGKIERIRKISQTIGNFTGVLDDGCRFGHALANLGDFNHDGVVDVAVGAIGDDDGGPLRGALWILQVSDLPWTWLGGALAGAQGEPEWFGEGPLLAGERTDFHLTNAAPNAFAMLLYSVGSNPQPMLGGTLVPALVGTPAALFPVSTSATGTFEWSLAWPAGLPSGATLYTQVWIADPSGPQGATASNALSFELP